MKIALFIIVSVMLNFSLFAVDMSVTKVAEEEGLTGATDVFNYEDSHIKSFDKGNFTLDEDIATHMPSGNADSEADADTGGVFTDTFKAIKDWLLGFSGVRFVLDLVNVLPNTLKAIFPGEYSVYGFGLGYIWHILVVISIIFWFKGGGS